MQLFVAMAILALTITLAVTHIKIGKFTIDHAVASIIGAILMTLFQIVHLDMWKTAIELLYMPMITITALMITTFVADDCGLFATMVQLLVEKAKGDGKKLYALLFFFGSFLGMLFSNDAVVLLFTPLVFGLVE